MIQIFNNRLSIDENSIQAKKLKRKGAFEVNKEKVSDWDSTVQSRRLAKSYDFTNHKSEQPLQTIEESSKKFKIETPLEAEISSLLFGKPKGGSEAETDNKNEFLKDHSKVELVSKELNHLAAILHVYAGSLKELKLEYRMLELVSKFFFLLHKIQTPGINMQNGRQVI